MKITEITNGIHYVGVNDRCKYKFENLWPLPYGVSYNAYLITDKKNVLIDTVDAAYTDRLLDNIAEIIGDGKIDYLIINHMEPDHSASIQFIRQKYPQMTIVGNIKTLEMVKGYYGIDDNTLCIKNGESLSIGKRTLTFHLTPMVHWPETMMTYVNEDKLIFSGDAFGCFGALNGRLFADEVDFDRDYLDEARRYYTNIVGKYGSQVQAVLKKAAELDIAMLLPLHGFVWRKELGYLLHKYDLWSRYEPEERGVLIAYASVYGHTEQAADAIAARLAERGVPNIAVYDVSKTHPSYILADAFRCSALVFASITYNNGIFCNMETLLHQIAAHNLQNRTVAFLENGSWAPVSVKHMTDTFASLKNMKVLEESLTIRSSLKNCQGDCLEALVDSIFQSLA